MEGGRANVYAQKKNWAQGFLVLALLMANATQMKLLIDQGPDGQVGLFAAMMTLLGFSIIFQLVVGVMLLLTTQQNVEDPDEEIQKYVDSWNNWAMGLILIITVVNVIVAITVFIFSPDPPPTAAPTVTVTPTVT